MLPPDSVQSLLGGVAHGSDGENIGSIGHVYLDNATGEPAWVTVRTGPGGSRERFVPLDQAELTDDGLRLPYDEERVAGAPAIEADRELTEQEEDELYAYYGIGTSGTTTGYDTRSDSAEPVRYAGYDAGTTPGSNPTLTTSDAVDDDVDPRREG